MSSSNGLSVLITVHHRSVGGGVHEDRISEHNDRGVPIGDSVA